MHELSVARRLVGLVLETASENDADAVEELTIEIGRATHLNPRQLRFCLEALLEGTPAANASVTFETIDPYGHCECGWNGRPDTVEYLSTAVPALGCPNCGGRIDLDRGRDCRLASITVPEQPTVT